MKKAGKKTLLNKLGFGLKTGILAGALSFLPMKNTNAEIIVNPFVQPNQDNLNWYGSGDVNNDNTVNWDDVSKMESIINGSYVPDLNSDNPSEYRTLDRADVNGDGEITSEDKQILENKLNGSIDYLPGEWDKLRSKEERENLHEQRHEFQWENKLDTIPYIPDEFDCDNIGRLNMRDFKGFPEMGYDKETGWRDNGRYKLPEHYVEIFYGNSDLHVVTGAVAGNKINSLDSWDIREKNGLKYGSDLSFPENCEVVIKHTYVKENEIQGKYLSSIPIVKFQVTNGNPELIWENDDPNVRVIKERDTTPPQNYLNFRNDTMEYEVYDDNFILARYSFDEGETWDTLYSSNGTKNLNLEKGYHDIIFESEDLFRNKTRTNDTFYVEEKQTPSLEKEVLDSKLKVYPNPATDYLKFENPDKKESQLRIYSTDGKEIENIYDTDGNINLKVNNYKSGMYFYRYENSGNTKTGKFLVK